MASLLANMGRITFGITVAMSGLMLGQFEEPESEIKLTASEGSWFGKKYYISYIINYIRVISLTV